MAIQKKLEEKRIKEEERRKVVVAMFEEMSVKYFKYQIKNIIDGLTLFREKYI